MTRKLILSITLVLTVASLFGSAAFAAEGDTGQPDRPFPGLRRIGVRGEITAVNLVDGTFSLHTLRGDNLTLITGERTKFRGAAGSLEAIEIGMPAAVLALRQDRGGLLALQVVVHEKLDRVRRYGGIVAAVDLEAGTLTLDSKNQGELVFSVDEKTRFRGDIKGLDDLETGYLIVILGASLDDGSLKALLIFAPPRLHVRRFAGEVMGIDLNRQTFTVLSLRGESLPIISDEGTDYLSRGGVIEGLEDLEVGMRVIVSAEFQPDGSLLGKRVLVHPPSQP